MFKRKKIHTKITLRSLKKGPVIKKKGIKEINKDGNVIRIFSFKFNINLIIS